LDAAAVLNLLEQVVPTTTPVPCENVDANVSWKERLWTAPAETRIGVRELAEALGRPRSWVYRRTGTKGNKAPLPHRKLDGELVFIVGEIRTWLAHHEVEITPSIYASAVREI
jgi:predicted DNA-binding transcriptional regulator AlpA